MSTATVAPTPDTVNPDPAGLDTEPTPEVLDGVFEELPLEQPLRPAPVEPSHEIVRYSHGSTELIHGASAADRVSAARDIANALNDVIATQGLRTKVGSKKRLDPSTGEPVKDQQGREVWEPRWHVDVEAWQTLATLLGCAILPRPPRAAVDPSTGQPIVRRFTVHEKTYYSKAQGAGLKAERSWEVEGYDWTVTVDIVKDGVLIASGTGLCSRTEPKWNESAEYAVQSMAATRATGRAMKSAAAWIVALAGYSTTPSEEMPATAAQEPPTDSPASPEPPRRIAGDEIKQFVDALARLTGAQPDRDRQLIRNLYKGLDGGEHPTVELATAILKIEGTLGLVADRDGGAPGGDQS